MRILGNTVGDHTERFIASFLCQDIADITDKDILQITGWNNYRALCFEIITLIWEERERYTAKCFWFLWFVV